MEEEEEDDQKLVKIAKYQKVCSSPWLVGVAQLQENPKTSSFRDGGERESIL